MVDYMFYAETYHGGSIPPEEWPMYEARAAEQLLRYKRIYTVTVPKECPDGEIMAVCAMADALFSFNMILNGDGGISSASIGSVSVKYNTDVIDVSPKGKAAELYRCASMYLDIYRGVS